MVYLLATLGVVTQSKRMLTSEFKAYYTHQSNALIIVEVLATTALQAIVTPTVDAFLFLGSRAL
jgi:hypothetical protein